MIRKQSKFTFLKEFRKKFSVDKNTVFVFEEDIFTNKKLWPDILLHEQVHIAQQKRIGARKWIKRYLVDDEFRKEQEVEAYQVQIASIKDREARSSCRTECAYNLSSSLYGSLMTFMEALDILK